MKDFVFKIPIVLTILSVIGGVLIAIVFGVNENYIKDKIARGLEQNLKVQAITDPADRSALIKVEAEKNWRYYQRYHFHANGIAGMTLALLIFLSFLQLAKIEHLLSSYMLAVGGFCYPFVWLFAGIYGPIMGRTEAKEAFAILGYMGGLYLVGVGFTLYLALTKSWTLKFPVQ